VVTSISSMSQTNLSEIIKSIPDSMKWGWNIQGNDDYLSISKFFENSAECQSNLDMLVGIISRFYTNPNSIRRKESGQSDLESTSHQSWEFGGKNILLYEKHEIVDEVPIHYLDVSEF